MGALESAAKQFFRFAESRPRFEPKEEQIEIGMVGVVRGQHRQRTFSSARFGIERNDAVKRAQSGSRSPMSLFELEELLGQHVSRPQLAKQPISLFRLIRCLAQRREIPLSLLLEPLLQRLEFLFGEIGLRTQSR
jgi:hypothetical protein